MPRRLDGCASAGAAAFSDEKGQDEDALGRRGAHGDARPAETAVEQQLEDQSSERVADEDRRLVERADLLLVVVDDLVEAEALDLLRVFAELLDVAVLARPFGRGDGEASALEVVGEVVPAVGCEPGSVDQHERSPVAVGRGCHVAAPFSRWGDPGNTTCMAAGKTGPATGV